MSSEAPLEGLVSELDELRTVIFGDLEKYEALKKQQETLIKDPAVRFHPSEYDMTREEAMKKSMSRTARIKELVREK